MASTLLRCGLDSSVSRLRRTSAVQTQARSSVHEVIWKNECISSSPSSGNQTSPRLSLQLTRTHSGPLKDFCCDSPSSDIDCNPGSGFSSTSSRSCRGQKFASAEITGKPCLRASLILSKTQGTINSRKRAPNALSHRQLGHTLIDQSPGVVLTPTHIAPAPSRTARCPLLSVLPERDHSTSLKESRRKIYAKYSSCARFRIGDNLVAGSAVGSSSHTRRKFPRRYRESNSRRPSRAPVSATGVVHPDAKTLRRTIETSVE